MKKLGISIQAEASFARWPGSRTCGHGIRAAVLLVSAAASACSNHNREFDDLSQTETSTTESTAQTGKSDFPKLEFNLTTLDFGSLAAGSTLDKSIILKNTGTALADMVQVNLAGVGFSIASNGCGTQLGAGSQCSITIRFAPNAKGTFSGWISAKESTGFDADAPLTGEATSSSMLEFTPASFNYGSVYVGQSTRLTLTLSNTGASSATSLSVSSAAPSVFSVASTTCTSSLAAGASCEVKVDFIPAAEAHYASQVQATDSNGSVIAGVSGEGKVPTFSVTPSLYDFGGVIVGGQATNSFVVKNIATKDASAFSVAAIGSSYSITTNGCETYSASFPAGTECSVTVRFSPSDTGSFAGFLVADATDWDPVYSELTGTGSSKPALAVTPTSHDFGLTYTSQSKSRAFTISNTGGGTAQSVTFSQTATAHFSLSNDCGGSIAGGASCTLTVTYAPSNDSLHASTVTVSYYDGLETQTLSVSVNGDGAYPPVLSISPGSHDFGTVTIGNLLGQQFTLSNTGSGAATSLAISTTHAVFHVAATTCGTSLAAASSCTIDVEFYPDALVSFSQSLQIDYAERTALGNSLVTASLAGLAGNGLSWNPQSRAHYQRKIKFVSATDGFITGERGLYLQTGDGGLTWKPRATAGAIGGFTLNHHAFGIINLSDLFIIGQSGLVLRSSNGGNYWERGTNTASDYWDLECAGQTCRGSGNWHARMLETLDGGASFTESGNYYTALYGTVSDIEMPDANTVYASGYSSGFIRASKDGGASFYYQAGNLDINHIWANSTLNAWAVGDRGFLRVTNDGGQTWQSVAGPTQTYSRTVTCSSATSCWVGAGDNKIYYTGDGGASWTEQVTLARDPVRMWAANASVVYVAAFDGYVFKTADGGTNWTDISPAYRHTTREFQRLDCASALDCVLSAGSGDTGALYRTVDGGATWDILLENHALYQITSAGGAIYSVGGRGIIQKSADGGATWSFLEGPSATTAKAVYFVSATTGWVGNESGQIYKTTDGGATWTLQTSNTTRALYRAFFLDANTGWMVGYYGTIVKTTDGGTNWTVQASGTTASLWGVHFLDANTGWIAGDSKVVRYTADGGANWSAGAVSGGTYFNARSIHFFDASNGIMAGYSGDGQIARTTDGGANWTIANLGYSVWRYYRLTFASDDLHGWLVGDFNSLAYTVDGGANWSTPTTGASYPYNTYGTHNLHDVAVVDESVASAIVVAAAASNGAVQMTSDGGASWGQANMGGMDGVYGLSRAPSSTETIWVSLGGPYILKSIDGGSTWSRSTLACTLNDLRAVDANHAVVTVSASCADRVYVTSDGGGNWTAVTPASTVGDTNWAIEVLDHTNGVLLLGTSNGAIYRGTNFGLTGADWARNTAEPIRDLYDMKFIDANTGWAVGNYGHILATVDGGATWKRQHDGAQTGALTTRNLQGVAFADANNGWAVGDYQAALRTTNGGATWTAQTPGLTSWRTWNFSDVAALDATTAVVGTSTGSTAYVSGGSTWTDVSPGFPDGYWVQQIQGFNRKKAYAMTDRGHFGVTHDGGQTWNVSYMGGAGTMYTFDMFFLDENNGWASGVQSIYRTTDGGATWTEIDVPDVWYRQGVHFATASVGWMVGDGGHVSKSIDGGVTWTTQTSGTTASLRSVWAFDANTALAVGASGTIRRTTDGGTNWGAVTSGTTDTLRDVWFVDASTGYAVGDYTAILKTTDGGVTWTNLDLNGSVHFHQVHAIDANQAWAVTDQGSVYFTTNGGSAWTSEAVGVGNLNGIWMVDGRYGWTVGESGGISQTWTGGKAP